MIDFQETVRRIAEVKPEPEDYTGEDGLLYCGKCRTPKQFRMETPPMNGCLFPHLSANANRSAGNGRMQSERPAVMIRLWQTSNGKVSLTLPCVHGRLSTTTANAHR